MLGSRLVDINVEQIGLVNLAGILATVGTVGGGIGSRRQLFFAVVGIDVITFVIVVSSRKS